MSELTEVNEVSADDAYSAAEERALRTTRALILAEAQIITWKRRYVDAMNRAAELEAEVSSLGGRTTDPAGGEGDGEGDPVGYAGAVGQAD
jgi:hypothetical protein